MRRRWPKVLALQLVTLVSLLALVGSTRLSPLFVFGVVLYWVRDVALSTLLGSPSAGCGSTAPRGNAGVRARRLSPALLATLAVVVTLAPADAVSAQTLLVGAGESGNSAPRGGQALTGPTEQPTAPPQRLTSSSPAALVADPARILFDEANQRLADAEDSERELSRQADLLGARISPQIESGQAPPELIARYQELETKLQAARRLVASRRDELNKAGNAILSKAYGGEYGTLARNWIDFKNTPSFLLGVAEGTPKGIVATGRRAGRLIGTAYDKITGAENPAVPVDPLVDRQERIVSRDQELLTELARIRGGAEVNRQEGTWYGENVIGPSVVGSAGVAVLRGVAVRGAVGAVTESGEPEALTSGTKTPLVMTAERSALRQAYVDDVAALKERGRLAMEAGMSEEDTARMLVQQRNLLKVKYRALSPPEAVEVFEQRNLLKYGDKLGPSADQLRAGGKSWPQIIDSSSRSGGKDLGL